MASADDIFNELQNNLGLVVTSPTFANSAPDDLYEAYVWNLVLRAAADENGNVQLQDRNGNSTAQLIFRRSPGKISAITNPLYTHARIEFLDAPPLEVHVGVRVQGRSGVLHECDVLVLTEQEAQACRDQDRHPRNQHVVLAIECKYYIASNPKPDLGRSFLGLTQEIRARDCHFVINTGAEAIRKLLSHYDRRASKNVESGSADNQFARAKFRAVFESFKLLNWTHR
jgi:hypothetical protein